MQLRRAEDGLLLKSLCERRVCVRELVDGGQVPIVEPPCAAQVDHLDAACKPLRGPLTRGLMRKCQKDELDAALADKLPGEGLDRRRCLSPAKCQLRLQTFQRNGARAARIRGSAEEERGSTGQARMRKQQARELAARIPSHARNRGTHRVSLSQ